MAGAVKNMWTTQGTGVFVNLEGLGKTEAEVVTKIADITSVSAITGNRDVKKKGTVDGVEYSAPGKRTYEDPEIKFLLNDKTAAIYDSLVACSEDVAKSEISVKVQWPWGLIQTFGAIVLNVGTPEATEDPNVVEVSVKLSVSGNVARTKAK
ncbi:hypothetical protein [Aeromonas taiwanensis]